MPTDVYTDQLGRQVAVKYPPKRIISLVPSQTELLFDLGLASKIVGITKFCIHPSQEIIKTTKIGGTKQVDIEKIHALKPDFIIANKEENDRQQIEELCKHYPVWISDIADLTGALDMINAIGNITNAQHQANEIIATINAGFKSLPERISKLKVAYLIWRNPYMAAGHDTFITDMLMRCGYQNCVLQSRYPQISVDELKQLNADIIMLSSEPYPFKRKHVDELQVHLPNVQICLVNGEMFSWYGSRLLLAPAYFKQLIAQVSV